MSGSRSTSRIAPTTVQASRMSPCGSGLVIFEFGAIIPKATMDRRVRETG